ncbi:MAG: hypothetical protein HRU05_19055 [Oceanospirillaceae bacterium]|nr:hypothetical protein [Oceanospirillaceae bacterium]
MEELKKLEEIDQPDVRNLFYSIINTETGESRPFDITDLYASVKAVELSAKVPEDVISQFNVARNLAIYSWHSYSFNQTSEMQSFSVVEMALKDRLGKHKYGFRGLIKKAVNIGLIKDVGFRRIKGTHHKDNSYSESLKDIVPHLRNNLAHGSVTLHPGAVATLQWSADFINQLYK